MPKATKDPTRRSYRIPYKGSKNGIADQLMGQMLQRKPKAKYFIDLFGGGGAMSFQALQAGLKVVYNDTDIRVVKLLKLLKKRILAGVTSKYGLLPASYYKFVDKKTFDKHINEETAYAGFLGACYSFGNNFRAYAFNKANEEHKHTLHQIIVYKCEKSVKLLNKKFNCDYRLSDLPTINERRLHLRVFLCRLSKKLNLTRNDANHQPLEGLEQLQRLQRLENIKNLENTQLKLFKCFAERGLKDLEILNFSYNEVLDRYNYDDDEVIIYCDPPYKNTDGYKSQFDYEEFINYLLDTKYSFFVSEYDMPAPFEKCYSVFKEKLLSSKGNTGYTGYTEEKLFNKKCN